MDVSGFVTLLSFVVIIAVVVVLALNDFVIAFLLQKILEPSVRWIQRVFLGIDRVRVGDEALIGSRAIAGKFEQSEDKGYIGSVVVDGETCSARAGFPIEEGKIVSITNREKLLLIVEPAKTE